MESLLPNKIWQHCGNKCEGKKHIMADYYKKSQVFLFSARNVISAHSSQSLRHILRECQKFTLIRMTPCKNICYSYPGYAW